MNIARLLPESSTEWNFFLFETSNNKVDVVNAMVNTVNTVYHFNR